MNATGSTQLGVNKKFLEQYPWQRFEPHPEWADGCFAAGIPGQLRFIYLPRRGVYNWSGIVVRNLERDVPYHAFYFNPTNGRHELGQFVSAGPPPKVFEGHTLPMLFEDRFQGTDSSAWKDYGTPTEARTAALPAAKAW